jgi:hypothetical protein
MKHHPLARGSLTGASQRGPGTLAAGQFYWGGILLKRNGGVRRWAQPGWQSGEKEDMDISPPDCETHQSSRGESRPK